MKEYLQWHPAFFANLKATLSGEKTKVDIEREYHLGSKPLQIDVIVKKESDAILELNIGRLFKRYNIMEYKSPDDYLSIDDYYKGYGYAYFYKANAQKVDEIKMDEMTITFVCHRYPKKLSGHLKRRGVVIQKQEQGIYYILGESVPIQWVVTSELSEGKNFWLKYLTNDLKDVTTAERIVDEYIQHQNDELYKSMMNVIVTANRELFEEVKHMCEALRELFREDIERALIESEELGIVKSIRNVMSNLAMSAEEAMNAVGVPKEKHLHYMQMLG